MLEFPPFRLDTGNQCLWRRWDSADDERILLPPTGFAVLRHLVEHAGRLVTERELLEAVWPRAVVEPQAVKKQVFEIRKVLGDDAKAPRYIETQQRRGYQFIAPVREGPSTDLAVPKRAADRLVGRERQLADLRDRLRLASGGQRQIVFITGEPGIGKTALVDELQRHASIDAPGIRIGRGQCIEGYGGKEAYYPVLEALGQLCHGSGGSSMVEILATQAPTWLVQFPALVKRELRETLRQEILGATRERMLREIGVALDTIAAQVPVLLVFEDLQWVDHSTVDLLSALARRRAPAKLMLITTKRPVDMTPSKELKQELLLHQLCYEIDLEPLTEAEVAEYLVAASNGAIVPEGLAGLIYRHTEGNPLFMVATLDHLTRRGLIAREQGSWQLRVPLAEVGLEVPESLAQMIEAQIARLSTEEQRALEAASVAAAVFAVNVGAAAIDVDSEGFENLCASLARRQRMVRSAGSQQFPDGSVFSRYEFAHALYRDVFYRRQAPLRRAKLHQRIGQRLEALYSQQLSEVGSELAHHFEEGADWPRAVKYLCLAADTAGRRYARWEAMAILQHALDLSSKLPEAQRLENETGILEKQATMWAVSFDTMGRAVECYESMAERARQYGLIDVEVRALIGMAYPLSWSDSGRCVEVAERALGLSAEQPDLLLRARARASCFYWRVWAGGWNPRAAEEFGNALAEIRKTGDRAVFAQDLLDASNLLFLSSKYRDAHQSAAEFRASVLESGDQNPYFKPAYQRSTNVLPWSLLFLGEWGEALRELKAGIATMEKNGDEFRAQTLHLFEAWVRLHAMDFDAVRAICQSAFGLLRNPRGNAYSRLCLILAGQAETGVGNYERALEHLSAARDAIDGQTTLNTWFLRTLLESALTDLCFAKEDVLQARLQAERFLQVAQATSERTWQALAWEANSRVAMTELDPKRAQECIANAISTMEGFEVPLAAWRVHATAAEVYILAGNKESAKRHRELTRATILKLADSLPSEEAQLRKTFLTAPTVAKILAAD
jgi:DNA-binding winged helix-turn-helix (wHTH) protein/tetratricopeptide (TPR) repeat protein